MNDTEAIDFLTLSWKSSFIADNQVFPKLPLDE